MYQWSKDALEEFLHIRDAHPEAGVWLASGYDLCAEEEQEHPRWLELVENRKLKPEEIPKGNLYHLCVLICQDIKVVAFYIRLWYDFVGISSDQILDRNANLYAMAHQSF